MNRIFSVLGFLVGACGVIATLTISITFLVIMPIAFMVSAFIENTLTTMIILSTVLKCLLAPCVIAAGFLVSSMIGSAILKLGD